jgi:hypothetical protein
MAGIEEGGDLRAIGAHERPLVAGQREALDGLERAEGAEERRLRLGIVPHPVESAGAGVPVAPRRQR